MTISLQFKFDSPRRRYVWKNADNHNHKHRLGGKPAWQVWYQNGQKRSEQYYENNQFHRLHGKPAYQIWFENGQKWRIEFYEHGEKYRLYSI